MIRRRRRPSKRCCSWIPARVPSEPESSSRQIDDQTTKNEGQPSARTPVLLSDHEAAFEGNCCGRERLKRHRVEVAGRVWIPELWGQEGVMKEWIHCPAFDAPSPLLMSARAALMEHGRLYSSELERVTTSTTTAE